jgi:SagB-type dehydrogenase family enzyme
MTNETGYTARAYHQATKHHRGQLAPSRRVEPALIPQQYKRYIGLPSLPLPSPGTAPDTGFDAAALSTLLHYTAGIIRRREIGGRTLEFRAASCTGALYHIEVYVVCGRIGAIPAGVYHYDVREEALRPLRESDHRAFLAAACAYEDVATAQVSLVFTSTFWRNAWRYEERAYRHTFWDTGTMLANLLALTAERGLESPVLTAFVDGSVHELLGIDGMREAAVCVVPTSAAEEPARLPVEPAGLSKLALETEALSQVEIEYPLIWRTHESSSLGQAEDVAALRARANALPSSTGDDSRWLPSGDQTIAGTVERRVSGRRFQQEPLTEAEATELLDAATRPVSLDLGCDDLVETYLFAHAVEGLESGVYRVHRGNRIELVRQGDLRTQARALALDQGAAGSAALNLYFVANLAAIESRLGDRGYRAVQLAAGARCGRVYLAATALGLKATGLTFYDDEVATGLGLDPPATAVLMLVANGR